jgi:RNA polymerase sigma-70 factor (ECF subfamily)
VALDLIQDAGELPFVGAAIPEADLGSLYRTHARDVARWVGLLGGPSIDVEDAVQEVFLVVHRRLGEFRGEAQIRTWLYRIARNVSHAHRRKARFRGWLRGTPAEAAGDAASPEALPSEAMERREATAQVHRILDALPERDRAVLVLFEIEGQSGEEIAGLMGAKVATVWVWLHRARARFLKRLRELEESHG